MKNDQIVEVSGTAQSYYESGDILVNSGMELDKELCGGKYVFFTSVILLASYFYALPFIRSPWGYTTHMRLDDVMTALFFIAVLFGAKNNYPILNTKAGKLLILVVIGMVVYYGIAKFFFGSSGTVRNQLYAIWQTVRYINYIVVFFLASRVIYNPKRLTILMWVVFFGGVFVALYGLAEYYGYISAYYLTEMFKEAIVWEAIATRGIFGEVLGPLSPNHAYCGTMLGTVLLFAWALFSGRSILPKLVLLSGGAIILFAFMLTRSRASLYAFPFAIMANMLFLKGRFRSFFLFALALLLFYFAMVQIPEIRERLFLQEGFGTTSGAARLRAWGLTLGWFARHPLVWLTGIGSGNWKAVIEQEIGFNAAHNNYIQFLIEGGMIGLTLFLVAIGMAIKHTYQIARCPIPEISRWGQAMFTAVTYWAVSALSQENFVPSIALGSLLSFCLFLLGVTCWAKQYVDERTLVSNEFTFPEPAISSEAYV